MSQLKKFNQTLLHFLNWILKQLPEETYLVSYYDICELAIKTNAKTSLEHFLHYVTIPHKTNIISQNEEFFLEKDIESADIDNDSLMNALRMKDLWISRFNDEQKATVWKYLKALVMLSEYALAEYQSKSS